MRIVKMTKQSQAHAVRAMPYVLAGDANGRGGSIAPRHLPQAPLAPAQEGGARPKKTEAERAMRSKAALLAMARRQGLRGASAMSLADLAKVLSH
jgi:hypothetical protein